MFPTKGKIAKVAVLRPGALGDVLAVRSAIRFIKDAFPAAELCLAAPGARGAFLRRPGWADRCHDWDRTAFSWLFSDDHSEPPPVLRAVFAGCNWIVSYVDTADAASGAAFEERLEYLTSAAGKVFCPSRPPAGHREPIGLWLAKAAIGFCRQYGLAETDAPVDWPALAAARIRLPAPAELAAGHAGKYLVLHPGSGSAGKNWPVGNFIALGKMALEHIHPGCGLVVVSGEADGDLGERVAAALPKGKTAHLHCTDLETLARTLAHAWLYVGNDSGVSHLAAAVESAAGQTPAKAVLFGPSDPAIWAPPGALVLRAGERMDALSPEMAWQGIANHLARAGAGQGMDQ